jgi:hypothetical protein
MLSLNPSSLGLTIFTPLVRRPSLCTISDHLSLLPFSLWVWSCKKLCWRHTTYIMAVPPEPVCAVECLRACILSSTFLTITTCIHNSHTFNLNESSINFPYQINPLLHQHLLWALELIWFNVGQNPIKSNKNSYLIIIGMSIARQIIRPTTNHMPC